jgi:hypothetical protein
VFVGCSQGSGSERDIADAAQPPVVDMMILADLASEPDASTIVDGSLIADAAIISDMRVVDAERVDMGAGIPLTPVPVFLMAGQSNMEGYGPVRAEDTGDWEFSMSLNTLIEMGDERAAIREPRSDVWIEFRHGDGRQPSGLLALGFGADARFIGPELGLGEVLGEELDEPIVMYKAAHGGTTLGADWRSPSAGGITGPLYEEMLTQFALFREQDLMATFPEAMEERGYRIAGFIWLQGWNDQFEDGFVEQYEDNLVALISDVRTALEDPGLPAIIVEGPTLQEELRQARQAAIGRLEAIQPGRTVFVETEDLVEEEVPGNFHFHFSARNYLEVGRRTGRALLEANVLP